MLKRYVISKSASRAQVQPVMPTQDCEQICTSDKTESMDIDVVSSRISVSASTDTVALQSPGMNICPKVMEQVTVDSMEMDDVSIGLKRRLSQLMFNSMSITSEGSRTMNLLDLFSVETMDPDTSNVFSTLLGVIDDGDGSTDGKIKYSACIRHTDVEVCPIGALGLYLFYRSHVLNEDLTTNLENVKLFRGEEGPSSIPPFENESMLQHISNTSNGISREMPFFANIGECVGMAGFEGPLDPRWFSSCSKETIASYYVQHLSVSQLLSIASSSSDEKYYVARNAGCLWHSKSQLKNNPNLLFYLSLFSVD